MIVSDDSKDTKYGIFIYTKDDENIFCRYSDDLEEAKSFCEIMSENNLPKDSYIELWEKPENNMWGSFGEPLLHIENFNKKWRRNRV